MEQLKKVAIVGVYGRGEDFTTGQAVKCHALIDWMKEEYGNHEVVVVNTYQWKKNPFRLFNTLFCAMRSCKNIVIMPAQHGIKVFAPLVWWFNKRFHREIHYIVIGGWLADMLKEKPSLRNCISSYQGVHVEAVSMQRNLEALGLTNVYYMPNSRQYAAIERKTDSRELPLHVCTYSRVVKSKGIEDAVKICRRANGIMRKEVFRLDVFGKVGSEYEKEFVEFMNENTDIAVYCGCRNADETLETLSSCYAMLFPTFYEGEGFAGTVLDAYAAEIPIIANDWKYNAEIITSGVDGFIYPFRDIEAAAQQLVQLYRDPALYKKIQRGCHESAIRFSTDHVLKEFSDMLK